MLLLLLAGPAAGQDQPEARRFSSRHISVGLAEGYLVTAEVSWDWSLEPRAAGRAESRQDDDARPGFSRTRPGRLEAPEIAMLPDGVDLFLREALRVAAAIVAGAGNAVLGLEDLTGVVLGLRTAREQTERREQQQTTHGAVPLLRLNPRDTLSRGASDIQPAGRSVSLVAQSPDSPTLADLHGAADTIVGDNQAPIWADGRFPCR